MSATRTISLREWLFAALGLALLGLGVHLTRSARVPTRHLQLADACRTPLSVLEPRTAHPSGWAVVFHGLSASRLMMQTLGQQLADAGLRVFLVDSPGHGDSEEPFTHLRAEQCAAEVVESLLRRGEISLDRTVFLGHSMGGAIAVRLADRFPAAATLAVSPAPLVPPRRMPANLLIVSAQLDMAMLKDSAQKLLRAAGGERTGVNDFRERRAARLVHISRATHTSLLFDRRVESLCVAWTQSMLGERSPGIFVSPGSPVAGGLLGLAGLLLMFPLAASGLALALGMRVPPAAAAPPRAGGILLRWIVAALLAVGVLAFWVPLRVLHLLTGEYLASFLLLAGLALLGLLWKQARATLSFDAWALAFAGALGLAAAMAFCGWINWQLADAWPNLPRWLRFLPLVLVCWPYFLAEATALGPPRRISSATEVEGFGLGDGPAGRNRWRRLALFLALRLVLFLALSFALFFLGSGQLLILLLAVYLALLALFERLGSDAVWRRTGSATAAAAFGAILTGWFFAAVFPLT